MRVCVTTEQRFMQTPDGSVWTSSSFPFSYWQRYLEGVFAEVNVIARVSPVDEAPQSFKQANGPAVTFAPIPAYVGPIRYLLYRNAVLDAIRRSVGSDDAIILRVGGQIGSCVEAVIDRDRPFAVEVVTDPWNIFAPGSVKHPLRGFFRWHFTRELQRQCRRACAAGYVTERFLQDRYPPDESAFHTAYAATELGPDAFVPEPRTYSAVSGTVRIITVGSLAQMYKGIDVLIDAVGACVRCGLDIGLTVVGDGQHRSHLERRASHNGITRRVIFTGLLASGKPVRDQLDSAHLFALVSRTEGLPGAMIEAMARALPCIGSTAGGIPELLPAEDIVPAGDADALASKITAVVRDPERLTRMSAANLSRAYAYSEEVLSRRRRELLVALRHATENWLGSAPASELADTSR